MKAKYSEHPEAQPKPLNEQLMGHRRPGKPLIYGPTHAKSPTTTKAVKKRKVKDDKVIPKPKRKAPRVTENRTSSHDAATDKGIPDVSVKSTSNTTQDGLPLETPEPRVLRRGL